MNRILLSLALVFIGLPLLAQEWVELLEEGTNFYEIQDAFYEYWDGKERERGQGYKQFKRWEYFMEYRVGPDGKLPPSSKLYRVWKEEKKRFGSNRRSTMPSWQSMGPVSWQSSSYNPGLGRVNRIVTDPVDPNTIYVGVPSGGLWKSIDGGVIWANMTDTLPVLGVSGIAIDPDDSQHIFIATGDGDGADTYSIGVLESFDGGMSWSATGLVWNVSQFVRGRKLIIDPNDGDRLWMASSAGVHRTTDGGATWTQTLFASIHDIELHPTNSNIVYACSDQFYRSTNGGASFSSVSNGLPPDSEINRYMIAVSPDEPDWVYVIGGDNGDSSFEGLYFSDDSGQSFETRATTPNIFSYPSDGGGSGGQSWYDMALAADPNNADILFAGGINVWKSTDGGNTFDNNTFWVYPNNIGYVHADIHELVFTGGKLYCGSDGGAFFSDDSGANWNDLSEGLAITQFYRFSNPPQDPSFITGGSQDNGTFTYDGTSWTHVLGADGMEAIADYTDINTLYACIQYGGLRKSINGGNNYFGITPPGVGQSAWVMPFVMHPSDNETLFAGYENIWKTTDGGTNWTQISNFTHGNTYRAVAVAPSNPNVIYASTLYNFHRTDNGGSNWTDIYSGLPGNARITYIAIHPNNPDSVWVSLSNYYNDEKVFFSEDGGSNWTDFSSGLPEIPVNTIVYQENSNDFLYAGTDIGVYYRETGMANWEPYNEGLPNVIIAELEIHEAAGKLRAATYGRGVWEIDLLSSSIDIDCGASVAISCGQTVIGNTGNGVNNVNEYSCIERNNSGPELVYAVTVHPGDTFKAALSNMSQDLDLYLLSACSELLCVAWGDDQLAYADNPGDYYLVVDGHDGASGSFTLDIECVPISCGQDIPAQCGQSYSDNTDNNGLNNWESYSCVGWNESGPEHIYRLETTQAGTLTASLSNLSSDLDVFILDACDPGACIAFGNNSAEVSNAAAGVYYIVVDGYFGASGSYSLQVDCPLTAANIEGSLVTEWSLAVPNAIVKLTGDDNQRDTTGAAGTFEFEVAANSSVTVRPEKKDNWRDGLSTQDLVMILNHLTQTVLLSSPFQLIAADGNGNGSISIQDLVNLQHLIVFNIDSIAGNTSWRFVPNSYTFPDPQNPWAEIFPEEESISDASGLTIADFTAIKTGDVSGNADGATQQGFANLPAYVRYTTDGVMLEILQPEGAFDGLQFSLQIMDENYRIGDIQPGSAMPVLNGASLGRKHVEEGLLHFSLFGSLGKEGNEPLITLFFEGDPAGFDPSSSLKLNSTWLKPEVYFGHSAQPLKLDLIEDRPEKLAISVAPNPAILKTNVRIELPQAGPVTVELLSQEGKLLGSWERNYHAGTYNLPIELERDWTGGVYFVRLNKEGESRVKKLIIQR